MGEVVRNVVDLERERFLRLQATIEQNDRSSLRARWEFGHVMLVKRNGASKLPVGEIGALVELTNESSRELNYRMQFASTHPTEEEFCKVLQNATSWWDVIKSLSKRAKPRPEPAAPPVHVSEPRPSDGFLCVRTPLSGVLKTLLHKDKISDLQVSEINEIEAVLNRSLKALAKRKKEIEEMGQ